MIEGVEKSYRDELAYTLGEDNPLIDEMVELKRSKNKKRHQGIYRISFAFIQG